MENKNSQIEEGFSQLIKNNELVYSLLENSDNNKDKLFICINYQDKIAENEFASLYTDAECQNLFKELKPSKGFNSTYSFEIPQNDKLYLKSNLSNEYIFYYKYCTEKDIDQIKINKKNLKANFLEHKKDSIKISFNCPFSNETEKFNTKYTIYISQGKNKRYKIFKDENEQGKKIVEGNKDTYEVEVKINPNQKDQFFYVVAETKDPKVSLRPKIIIKGGKIPEPENKTETIINAILIVMIIITFIYKIYKRKFKFQKTAESNSGNSTLI